MESLRKEKYMLILLDVILNSALDGMSRELIVSADDVSRKLMVSAVSSNAAKGWYEQGELYAVTCTRMLHRLKIEIITCTAVHCLLIHCLGMKSFTCTGMFCIA